MPRGGVSKPPEERADDKLVVRVREDQKDAYQAMADYEEMSLSAWVKMILDRAAAPKKRSRKKN